MAMMEKVFALAKVKVKVKYQIKRDWFIGLKGVFLTLCVVNAYFR